MMTNHCVEVASFSLKPGVTDEQTLAIEAKIRSGTISSQTGFISRELFAVIASVRLNEFFTHVCESATVAQCEES